MAKAPSAKVSKTSGQGISRLSYQKARSLTGGANASIKLDRPGSDISERRYAKQSELSVTPINISYGDTYEPTDLKDIKALGELEPTGKASAKLSPVRNKKWSKK